ncbi:hypothetical protein BT93_B0297 [Corymbia citriodora subsp. variegata]|nr:hypothetical protein BT93_B0297 [Corymbia citriodora subsp. variegata]KAF8037340.1 hypothetical protein BT93_B0297 [Corymbia citriodora subsp. variegata]KAF8037343.1 hypothetical protein BT93_B0297 [Corymbia citriodora subsp. variegata]
MMVRHTGKKRKVDGQNSEQVDGEHGLSTEKLQKIHDRLEMEVSDKVLEIDQKHNETGKPVYEERNEIVQLIPDFWPTAFLSHPMLGERLTEEDRKIFKYLDFLDVEESEDVKSGYSITFSFRPNPFFEDSKLTKTFTLLDEETRITATSIKWKEGMGLPNGAAREKKGNKRPLSGESIVTRHPLCHYEISFFHWFSDAQHKDVTTQIHHEIADIIKEVWANPLTHFKKDADEAYEDMETVNGFSPNIKCVTYTVGLY